MSQYSVSLFRYNCVFLVTFFISHNRRQRLNHKIIVIQAQHNYFDPRFFNLAHLEAV